MKWTLPLKGHVLSSKESSFPGMHFVWKFLCIMSTIGLTKNRESWFASQHLWDGLIWITVMKIPQDVLKMILESVHVVAENGMLRMLSLLQYCSREFFLRIPITIRWATNTFISSGLVSSQLFSCAQGFWSTPSLSNSIRSLSPLSFACLSFAWTYLLVFSLSSVHILSSKNSSKTAPGVHSFNPCSFDRIPQIYIYLGDQYLAQV